VSRPPGGGDGGIEDIGEPATFHGDIAGTIPEFNGIAESDVPLAMPDRAANETEVAVSDGNMRGMNAMTAMHAGVLEAQVFKRDVAVAAGKLPLAP